MPTSVSKWVFTSATFVRSRKLSTNITKSGGSRRRETFRRTLSWLVTVSVGSIGPPCGPR
ncbi:hypothetical protein QFZ74_005419 [Streptomyces sp. V3I7]|nr:hypothetical protein [Streptomyces sp. V3I7]